LDLSDTTTIVALVALGLAVAELILCVWFLLWVRRVRGAQRALLAGKNVDLVEFAVGMQARQEQVEAIVDAFEARLQSAETHVGAALSRRALVRYDALGDGGGNQSTSVAILDSTGTGLVISAIQGRDYARIYVKDVVDGEAGSIDLTPEERRAVERARG
jgi:hypothetical protein